MAAMVLQFGLQSLGKAVFFPRAGACLFFVLSGYLITALVLRSREEAEGGGRCRALGAFYARFWLRTWPVYLLAVALALASDTGPVREVLPWLLTHTVNFGLVLRGEWINAFSHFWVLSVEQQFALVWPLFLLFAPGRWLLPGAVALAAVGPLYRGWAVAHQWGTIATYCPTPACLDTLGAGALLGLLGRDPGPRAAAVRATPGAACLLAGIAALGLLFVLRWHGIHWPEHVLLDAALALVFGWLVYRAGQGFGGLAGWVLEFRPVAYLGKISYGVYVYHALLPYLVLALGRTFLPDLDLDERGLGPGEVAALVVALAALAALSWHFLERPILALTDALGRGPGVAPAAPTSRKRGYVALAAWAGILLAVLTSQGVESWKGHVNRDSYARRAQGGGEVAGTAYFVSPSGNDDSAGTSPAAAWRTLDRVNRHSFRAGDLIQLEGGQEFAGCLRLDFDDEGTPDHPVVLGSYGSGRATVNAGDGCGIRVRNTMGVQVRDLLVVGSGPGTNRGSGVVFENDLAGDVKLPGVGIDRVEVRGFGHFGVLVDGRRRESGFRDVRVTNVVAHGNALGGICVRGRLVAYSAGYAHEGVYVGSSSAHHNDGVAGPARKHSGSGIVLSDVDGATVERCVAYENGRACDSQAGGPVGIWAWDANRVVIQQNESYWNRSGGPHDGGGFDLDGGVTNSVLQYNYSHDNDGPGYLLCQFPGARRFGGNTVRYNVSQDDGRNNEYGAIHVQDESYARGVQDSHVYNNTVHVTPSPGSSPSAIFVQHAAASRIAVRNNIFRTAGGLPLVTVRPGQEGLTFQANNYFTDGAAFRISWEGMTYPDLAAWRAATRQERFGGRDVGSDVNPGLRAPGRGRVLGDPNLLPALDAYRLRDDSPLVGAGLDLAGVFGIEPGAADLFGNRLPRGRPATVGAHEAQTGRGADPATAPSGSRPAAGPRDLVLGRWEGENGQGKREGIEFLGDGTFRITWEGTTTLPGRYRFLDEGAVEVVFNPLYRFRARLVVTPETLVLAVTGKGQARETSYRRVEQFSFAGGQR
jgi:peptidoglycan/LPS O-acetylase OafA/YrhL